MRRGIPVTAPGAVLLVALVLGVVAIGSGYLYLTEGVGSPWLLCPRPIEPPLAWFVGGLRVAIGVGFLVVAVRNVGGLRLRDPAFLALALTLAASVLLTAGARGLATGVVYWGRQGCLEIGPPWSYGTSLFAVVAGAVALYAATLIATRASDTDS